MTNLIKNIFTILIALICVSAPLTASAAGNFSVSPLLVDLTANVRDTFTRTVTLTNNDNHSLRLFASVNEITVGEESEIKSFVPASMSDRSTTVTSWVSVTRGRIDLKPGETKDIPLNIEINPNTPAGLYHAFVGFANAPNRDEAEAQVLAGQGTGVVLRILVGAKQQEFLRLVSFSTDRFSFSPTKGEIRYTLENTGDVPLAPFGDVIIYDSRGRELTSIDLNNDKKAVINPGEQVEYKDSLPFINRLGKNKAFLSLEYGEVNRASVYDTSFYYSVPWLYLILIVLLLAVVLTVIVLLLRRGSVGNRNVGEHEVYDLPLFVRNDRNHSEYEHDIDLKKKDL